MESLRKTVRHREGGVVADLLVREGVRAGQVLLRMDTSGARSEAGVLRAQHVDLQAQQARPIDKRDQAEAPLFPATVNDEIRAAVAATMPSSSTTPTL